MGSISKKLGVVVTGGASGLGLTMVEYFASQGHAVTIFDVNTQAGHQVAADLAKKHPEGKVDFKFCNITSWDSQATAFREVYEKVGHVDIVMANAGISEQGVSSLSLADEEEPSQPRLRALEVNLTGTIYTVKLAIHYLKKNTPDPKTGSRGCIICTASNAGLYPFPVAPVYAASKSGIIGLVRSLDRSLEKLQIQINALAPAVLETSITPSKALFEEMIITPHSTLVKGIAQLVEDPKVSGAVAEIHGENVTLRTHHEYVDDDTKANMETFWKHGIA
ncbi:putative short chain dehydrogenase/reductase [Annulohypoxylon maeteangense]|uniref:putative short chain dehydrogenase/reductase n=1 Tax=Annulohypoxylon maeteangense TaxID=1927788 RepID=UPI002008D7A1|nr:putative short chain dehydrogenase/reductase [Annulohypoxylon maeteangense]KAI0886941.1 putative short chain dehydrogenase/reductase [Annulohypoxylon maeteangense]